MTYLGAVLPTVEAVAGHVSLSHHGWVPFRSLTCGGRRTLSKEGSPMRGVNRAGTEPRGPLRVSTWATRFLLLLLHRTGPNRPCWYYEPTPLVISDWSTLDTQVEWGPSESHSQELCLEKWPD